MTGPAATDAAPDAPVAGEAPGASDGAAIGDNRVFRRLVLERLVAIPIVLLAVSLLVFLATQALPGDAANAILGRDATPARLSALRNQLGTDRPLPSQYWRWISSLAHGDLGTSLASQRPVSTMLGGRLINSAALTLLTCAISFPIAIALGVWSAVARGRRPEQLTSTVTLVLASLPEFVVGVVMIVLFATGVTHLLPAVSSLAPGQSPFDDPKVIVLPAATLILLVIPYVVRMVRAAVGEVLGRDYVELARLKGIPERTVIRRHVIPNALAPIAQVLALVLAVVAGGSVVIETLFAYPGIGLSLVEAVRVRDLPVIQVLTLGIAGVYAIVSLTADITALAVNPRARTATR